MKRRFFLRRALKYFLLVLIPTLLIFAFSLVYTIQGGQESLRRDGRITLQGVSEHVNLTMNGVIRQNDHLIGANRILTTMRRILSSESMSYMDSVVFTTIRATLNSITGAEPSLESIYYWLEKAPRVFTSSDNGILLLDSMKDTAWMEAYRTMGENQQLKLILSGNRETEKMLTLVKRMQITDGCIVLNYNIQQAKKELLPLLQREGEALFLFNEGGISLLQIYHDAQSYVPDEDDFSSLLTAEPGQWITRDGRWYLLDREYTEPLTAVTLVPLSTLLFRMKDMLRTLMLVLAIDLAVVILIAWYATRRISNQMNQLIDMFEKALHGQPVTKPQKTTNDEYGVIMDNIAYVYLRDTALQSRIRDETLLKENAELMALQLQINPHFLYNTLQTLDYAILSGNVDRQDISDVFHDLYTILRYALSNPKEPVTLAEELEKLHGYADIQRFRFGSKFVMYIEVDDDVMDAQVFRMMLQPLVENSMIHGLNGLKDRGHIWVRASRKEESLFISVTDTGVGMTEEECSALLRRINDPDERSIGLTNLNRRLLLSYGPESALRITSVPYHETVVSFSIPYIPHTAE